MEGHPHSPQHLPVGDRPRERLMRCGAANVSNAELLAIIWGTGSSGKTRESALSLAQRALGAFGSLRGLAKATITELRGLPGVGEVKAIELQAALELGRRLAVSVPEERPAIHSPREVVNLVYSEMTLLEQEELWLLLLSSKNEVLAIRRTYRGTINSSAVRVAELFRAAIRENAASIIITHNHPSGAPRSVCKVEDHAHVPEAAPADGGERGEGQQQERAGDSDE